MAGDALVEAYNEWVNKQVDASLYTAFQAGFTASAVSMRKRAMACCDGKKDVNEIKNTIGSLSDIPSSI